MEKEKGGGERREEFENRVFESSEDLPTPEGPQIISGGGGFGFGFGEEEEEERRRVELREIGVERALIFAVNMNAVVVEVVVDLMMINKDARRRATMADADEIINVVKTITLSVVRAFCERTWEVLLIGSTVG